MLNEGFFGAELADSIADFGFCMIDHFINPELVHQLRTVLAFRRSEGAFKKAGIGKDGDYSVDKSIRGDFIYWIEQGESLTPTKILLSQLHELRSWLNQTCFLGIKDLEAHFTVYPTGTFYKRHLDQFKSADNRLMTFICYLNEEWTPNDGGQLRLFVPKESGEQIVDVLPTAGRLVLFRSDLLEHEVLPTMRERLSVTGWMLKQPLGLGFL